MTEFQRFISFMAVVLTWRIPVCPQVMWSQLRTYKTYFITVKHTSQMFVKHLDNCLCTAFCVYRIDKGWLQIRGSWDSVVTRPWAGRLGARIPSVARHFSCRQIFQTGSGAYPPSGYWVSLLGVKLPGYDVVHLPPSALRLRLSRAIPLLPLHNFMVWTDTILCLQLKLK